ncbi:MAG: hypothetical protein EOO90_18740 [Pedobacter sp.]|nr:MAG: hypothetical protein EOO90_18740 [Pedobacter sp.]
MKKLFLSFSLVAVMLLSAPSSKAVVNTSQSSSCDAQWYDTFYYYYSLTNDYYFSYHQADFAYANCINAGEPQVPQPPQ